jgi:hypothetical protein
MFREKSALADARRAGRARLLVVNPPEWSSAEHDEERLTVRILRSLTFPVGPAVGIIAAAIVLAVWQQSHAQTPDPEIAIVRGNVEDFVKTADGETEGAVLDNETETVLYWPARLQVRFAEILKPGVRIRATGRRVIGPDGNPRFLVRSLTDLRTGKTVENEDFVEAPPVSPAIPPAQEPKEGPPRPVGPARNPAVPPVRLVVRGDIERFTESPRGEIDGAILDNENETVLHWPARLQDKFNGILKVGDRARATGHRAVSPTGNQLFVVKNVTNVRTGETVENPDYREPRPAPVAEPAPRARPADWEQRIAQLETQIDELRREIARLRDKK